VALCYYGIHYLSVNPDLNKAVLRTALFEPDEIQTKIQIYLLYFILLFKRLLQILLFRDISPTGI